MRDYIDISPVPTCEDPQQVGTDSYDPVIARKECQIFLDQLRRHFGPEPEGAHLAIKSHPHDFGNYLSVVCYYDDNFPESVAYAFACEDSTPEYWDEISHKALGTVEK